ncbi:hypothetical protein [Bradyrhizobium sp. RDI18]|uniref:hypothetical protein n=1 Tax=Bradyrhizobium sp. RDI18 TaxID=3367400 RepID=UPI0037192DB6
MSTKIGPPGWQPHAIVSRLDGFVSVNGRVPDFITNMMATTEARTNNRSIAAIRARMLARQRVHDRSSRRLDKRSAKERRYD